MKGPKQRLALAVAGVCFQNVMQLSEHPHFGGKETGMASLGFTAQGKDCSLPLGLHGIIFPLNCATLGDESPGQVLFAVAHSSIQYFGLTPSSDWGGKIDFL